MRGTFRIDRGFAEYVETSVRVNDLYRAVRRSRSRHLAWVATLFVVGLFVPCAVPCLMASEGDHAGR